MGWGRCSCGACDVSDERFGAGMCGRGGGAGIRGLGLFECGSRW